MGSDSPSPGSFRERGSGGEGVGFAPSPGDSPETPGTRAAGGGGEGPSGGGETPPRMPVHPAGGVGVRASSERRRRRRGVSMMLGWCNPSEIKNRREAGRQAGWFVRHI